MTPWFALITNPKCELRAKAGLEQIGVETYLPWGRIWSKPKRADGVVMRLRPAFPRYIFIRFPGRDGWQGLPAIDGVQGYVAAQGNPLPIPESQIAAVRASEEAGDLNFNREPRKWVEGEYAAGDRLRVTEGPFAGLHGVVHEASGKRSVKIEIMMFGRLTVAEEPLDRVKRAA